MLSLVCFHDTEMYENLNEHVCSLVIFIYIEGHINTGSHVNCYSHRPLQQVNSMVHAYVLPHTVCDFVSFVKQHSCKQCISKRVEHSKCSRHEVFFNLQTAMALTIFCTKYCTVLHRHYLLFSIHIFMSRISAFKILFLLFEACCILP